VHPPSIDRMDHVHPPSIDRMDHVHPPSIDRMDNVLGDSHRIYSKRLLSAIISYYQGLSLGRVLGDWHL
jgi:hypothetical protein